MILYSYYRSTSSYRVRIALELKGIDYTIRPINLVKDGGEHHHPAYLAINPQGRVPTLIDGPVRVTQSPSIIEYLEEVVPKPALITGSPERRALARSVAAVIGCDIHPLHNVSVLNKLRAAGHGDEFVSRWIQDWITEGFRAAETLIEDSGWALSTEPGLADVYLLPQIYAARRFGLDVAARFPKIARLESLAEKHPAFQRAHPSNQIDTPAV
ncbi:maleylacetoacetate isomerase [Pseudomonas alliivorans]|nr:maleylacetoacetate isomerase [Pseudomonas alliivorans]MEE4622471.1 maleylacetoacetate isomerase [Pseudomonas alliivorans]MEE4662634.1 maleylacetoacetate isomerase [Pseudomonas alliivorans]MEE4788154.1 maleylacetoacetate isomerase [Pseudomonas alliivorans]MEE4791498.1 maleylacetoacetate isomerase [Pseudomonas alliivorans]